VPAGAIDLILVRLVGSAPPGRPALATRVWRWGQVVARPDARGCPWLRSAGAGAMIKEEWSSVGEKEQQEKESVAS
jgi:hypothetical protein